MVYLTLEQACRETKNDAAATTILKLSYRVLTDVSCLSKFRNLEKLDLSGNCISSLKDLSSCVNLKWLSVVENKLETLEGVEGLSKLTVLNAGKNMLQRMGGIESVTSLHALILNDNKISSICKLDQLSFLNTLVLSRNPIHDIGHSLKKATSITKLSFSHCQIENIGSSLASCVNLKEARFSHNMIMTLPAELARNSSLQNLDVGNNLIENWSDIKVLSALQNLKNLNLQGNPIAEKDKLTKKVKELAPNLKIFNAKPLERIVKSKTTAGTERSNPSKDNLPSHVSGHGAAAKVTKKKMNLDNTSININKSDKGDAVVRTSKDVEVEKVIELKKLRLKPKTKTQVVMDNDPMKDSSKILQLQGKKMKGEKYLNKEQKDTEGADGAETRLFVDLAAQHSEGNRKVREPEADGEVVAVILDHAKRRKRSRGTTGALALHLLPSPSEVGMGGPSAWDD